MPATDSGASLLISEYSTPQVARAISVQLPTLLGWQQRHALFGHGSSNRQARYSFAFVEVCVAALIADLTRHGLPLSDAIAVSTAYQETFITLVRNPSAQCVLWLYRELAGEPMIVSTDDPVAAGAWPFAVTRVDLREILTDVIRGLGS